MNQKPPVYIQNFWHANNYGAVITGYALYKIIEQKGYDTKLIDVSTTEDKRKYNFNKFINKYCKTTKHIQTYSDLEDIIDPTATYIAGSDQIFRPDLAKDNLSNFLLDYLKTQRKIAFSASFGLSKDEFIENNSKKDVNHIKDSLQSFDFVSVREYDGVDICKNVFNVDAEHIIDPVFILDKTKYDEIIKTSKKNYQNKIVSYVLHLNNMDIWRLKRHFKENVINIVQWNDPIEDWLNAIKNCKFLITDSFHGACMALIFNKPFICIIKKDMRSPSGIFLRGSSRFKSIFKMLGIENQGINSVDEIYKRDCIFNIDYNKVNRRIEEEKKYGNEALDKALSCPIGNLDKKDKIRVGYLEEMIHKLERKINVKG